MALGKCRFSGEILARPEMPTHWLCQVPLALTTPNVLMTLPSVLQNKTVSQFNPKLSSWNNGAEGTVYRVWVTVSKKAAA